MRRMRPSGRCCPIATQRRSSARLETRCATWGCRTVRPLPVMAHNFRTRSAFHDFMFLSELQLDSCHYENRAEETRARQEDEFGSRPPADREVGDQGDTGECEACSSDIHTGRARRAHIFPQCHVHRNETDCPT
jgi:hypothetical protein